ncbi:thioesterase family protein [Lipingzhangella rawalii]|uniref:thioesterase family protein n=1 Tax=Lipingzhangella rawalii TaxID=2055835 RepID=UPI003898DC3E
MAHFGDLRSASGPEHAITAAPQLPPPEECVDPLAEATLGEMSIVEQVEYRTAEPVGFMHGSPSGVPRGEFWMRLRGDREPDLLSLAFLVDAAAPIVLELGETAAPTLELTTHLRDRPTSAWLACRVETRHVTKGFHEEDFEIWDATGRLVAQSRQLAMFA